jgi:hypothetical protein
MDRYRALKAIEQTIADFATLEDIAGPLSHLRDQVQGQIEQTREYCALRKIDQILPELSEVLALLVEQPASESSNGSSEKPGSDMPADVAPTQGDFIPPDAATEEPPAREFIAFGQRLEWVAATPASLQDAVPKPESAEPTRPSDVSPPEPVDQRYARPPAADPDAAAPPSLADSVAQLMAQSAPPSRDSQGPHAPPPQDRNAGAAPPQSERAA